MSGLKSASVKNLARKGPAPYSFVLGDPQPWGIVDPEIELAEEHAQTPEICIVEPYR